VPFGLMAHVDTSPDQSGEGVRPLLRERYDGSDLTFPDDPLLVLSQKDSPQLADFIGDTIITASGKTLLGADDKAGVAEVMTALATLAKFPELPHGRIEVCFTMESRSCRKGSSLQLRMPGWPYIRKRYEAGPMEVACALRGIQRRTSLPEGCSFTRNVTG
jgi:tripeptide aminopeptidase